MHGADAQPSAWLQRWVHLVRPGGRVLDLACGSGRNLRWLAGRGFPVTGVDRDEAALAPLRGLGEIVVADLESRPWPLPGRCFDLVLVTNYLWRALLPAIVDAVAEDGVLVYETFADGQQTVGRPSRPEFLLQPGELLRVCAALRVVAYEDGFDGAAGRFVQRIVAVHGGAVPARFPLAGPGGPAG